MPFTERPRDAERDAVALTRRFYPRREIAVCRRIGSVEAHMVSRHEFDSSNTARVTMNNPRTGHMQCVDVFAHPQDIAQAVIMFARNQGIRPTEVELSTVWPRDPTFAILRSGSVRADPITANEYHLTR